MRMVDRLLWISGDSAGAEFTLTPACPLLDHKNTILPVGLIEVAAQACAAWQGFAARSQELPIRQGYLVGVDKFRYQGAARAGGQLLSTLALAAELDNFMIVDARVDNHNGIQLASLRLKVFALSHD
jgi:predicted hotdog family 3-hydroxylacyl-ACP dehydratase